MAKSKKKRPEHTEKELQAFVYPLTKGNGPPIKLGELLDLVKVMNDDNADQDARYKATARLLPYYHELPPERTIPWPDYAKDPHARTR